MPQDSFLLVASGRAAMVDDGGAPEFPEQGLRLCTSQFNIQD